MHSLLYCNSGVPNMQVRVKTIHRFHSLMTINVVIVWLCDLIILDSIVFWKGRCGHTYSLTCRVKLSNIKTAMKK